MPAARHRIQDIEHHFPDDLQRSGIDAFGQIQNETQRPETVLFKHGGYCAQGWCENSSPFG